MNISDVPKWIGIAVIGFGAAASYAVNDNQIEENKVDIKELQKDKEPIIRMEVRQEEMQKDIQEIKQLIKEVVR